MTNIAPLPRGCTTDLALSDLSPRDESWDHHRASADTIQDYYQGRYSQRVSKCAQLLGFRLVPDALLGEYQLKLNAAHFCRVRHCPVCQWRRSLQWMARAYEILPEIVRDYPHSRFLFLTLTLRNCEMEDLRTTLSHMNKAYRRMTRLRAWPATGWLRSTEVTKGKGNLAHPHFHCLLMVKSGYLKGKGYLTHQQWIDTWQRSLKVSYRPHVRVNALSKDASLTDLVPEILKYSTKEADLTDDRDWFLELTRQTHKLRFVSTSGIIKQYLSSLEEEPDDLIGEGDDSLPDEGKLYFSWRKRDKRYRHCETARERESERVRE